MRKPAVLIAVAVIGVARHAHAQQVPDQQPAQGAASDVRVTVGLKVHANRITSSTPVPIQTVAGLFPVSDSFRSSDEVTYIPVLSARYKDLFFSGSYLTKTSYSAVLPSTGISIDFDRKEYDLNIGYYVLPGLAFSVGYKDVKVNATTGLGSREDHGPTVGLSAAAPLGNSVGLYASLAAGRLKVKVSPSISAPRNNYVSSEVGLFYTIPLTSNAWVRSLNVTAGYRYQTLDSSGDYTVTRLVPLGGGMFGVNPANPTYNIRTIDTSRGPVIGLVATF